MKIHIVKKGDTLWKIAEMYEVDYEELKEMNGHLSHPDMIMPGMKIRVPVHKKETKKETKKKHKTNKKEEQVPQKKEMQKNEQKPKEQVKQPQPTKPMKEIKEDDIKDHIHIQPVIPFEQQKSPSLQNKMPSLPSMPNLPQITPVKEEKKAEYKEKKKEKPVKKKEEAPKIEHKSESIPLTSHGCHCYCGTCTPLHVEGAQMMPEFQQQMPMPMLYPSHACGCQQHMMHWNQMQQPMQPMHCMQQPYMMEPMMGQHMPGNAVNHQMMPGNSNDPMHQENMHHPMAQGPMNHQMMPGNSNNPMHQENMNHTMDGSNIQHQMPPHSYDSHASMYDLANQQMPQQEYVPENWQRENMQQEEEQPKGVSEEQSVRQSYPPMYSDQEAHYSYPQPPE